jgi:hypothetical protein
MVVVVGAVIVCALGLVGVSSNGAVVMAKTVVSKKVGLAAHFTKAAEEAIPRVVGSSFGEVGTLKTSWWLGAPGPIVIQSLDRGTEGVVDVYLKRLQEEQDRTKDIYVVEYDSNTHEQTQEGAEAIAAKIETDLENAIESGARTVLLDKETQAYEIFKFAVLGAPTDAPANYYPLFQRYRAMINMAKDAGINYGLIQGMKTPWVKELKQSGKLGAKPSETVRVRRGMPEIEELVHINIRHFMERVENKQGELVPEFFMEIGKSRGPGGRDIQNTTIPFMSFEEFAVLMFPDTDESDWY